MSPGLPPRPQPVRTDAGVPGGGTPAAWLDEAPLTRALLVLNAAVFAAQVVAGGKSAVMHVPLRLALAFGANDSLATVSEGRWETLVTACFLHDGLFHLGFNLLALWQAGPLVEKAAGSARMALLLLLAGVSGNASSVATAWLERSGWVTLGSSGAIAGVFAAAMVLSWRSRGLRDPMTRALGGWLALMLAFGFVVNLRGEHISNAAHVGGAIAGASLASVWRRGWSPSQRASTVILAACTSVLLACIAVVAYHDRTDRFAALDLQDRFSFTEDAIADGRCADARAGVLAVERLRAPSARVPSLRDRYEQTCLAGAPRQL